MYWYEYSVQTTTFESHLFCLKKKKILKNKKFTSQNREFRMSYCIADII